MTDELNEELLEDEALEQDVEELETLNGETASQDELSGLKAAYEAGEELSAEELDHIADISVGALRSILNCFGEQGCAIDEYEGDDGELILDVNGGDLAVLIGRHGRVLDALQLLVSSLVSSELGFHYPIVVDIEGYKNRRRQKLQALARSAAARAKKNGGAVRLKPMNAYERRLVHLALIGDEEITTYSEGEDPDRYVVIDLV